MPLVKPDYRCPKCREIVPKGEALFAISQARNLSDVGAMLRRPSDAMVTCPKCGRENSEEEIVSGLHDAAHPKDKSDTRGMTILWWALGLIVAGGSAVFVLMNI